MNRDLLTDGLKGFDLFADKTNGIIKAMTDPETKRGLLELYAEEVIKSTKEIIRSSVKQKREILEKGIVYKISADNNQVLIGWTKEAAFGAFLETGYIHVGSHAFIKIPHLRPGANTAKRHIRVTARQYLQSKLKDYTP